MPYRIVERADLSEWEERYLSLAQHVSTWSKDPSTKVGSVITKWGDKRFVSLGFNGFPQHVKDTQERLENRELKYKLIQHAELNAMGFAEQSLNNCTIFVWPFTTCCNCAGHAIQKGITKVIAPFYENERWVDDQKIATEMLVEAGVELKLVR